jgi:hypothetical protein
MGDRRALAGILRPNVSSSGAQMINIHTGLDTRMPIRLPPKAAIATCTRGAGCTLGRGSTADAMESSPSGD